MATRENINSTVTEFKSELMNLFDEKMHSTKSDLTNLIDKKLRDILEENYELLKGYDEEYIKLRQEKDDALLKIPRGRFTARLDSRGGSLKKKRRKYFIKKKTRKNKSNNLLSAS